MYVKFNVDPVGKPRMTRSDRWRKRPATAKCWQFKDDVTLAAENAGFMLPDVYAAVFHIAMPKSWSTKQRDLMRGTVHQQKPDKNNIEKAINDSLRDDDNGIWGGWSEKRWADLGSIELYTGSELARHLASVLVKLQNS